MPNEPRPTLVGTRHTPRKALPAGVCARWGAFVAERGAQEALRRIAIDCDCLLHRLEHKPDSGDSEGYT